MVGHSLGKHSLAGSRRPVEQHTTRRVDADLAVQLVMGERQLHRLADLLFLYVCATNLRVRHIRPLGLAEQRDARVCLRRQNVHQRIGMAMQCHRCRWLQQLPVECAQDANIVIGACGGGHDAVVGIHHFQKLSNHKRHALNALNLLLSAQQLPLQVPLLLFDVLLLDLEELQLPLQSLEPCVQVLLLRSHRRRRAHSRRRHIHGHIHTSCCAHGAVLCATVLKVC
mmetsp:Transcript_34533/g.61616  ORF Transcript_34533/g.61616 Transcript_34533/m.61616 type:complete len:226 (-) Transcript_34533:67-744(-)